MSNLKAVLRGKFLKEARKAFLPVVSTSTANESLIETKFGGRPFVEAQKYPWPACTCGKKMLFFLQLNSNSLPEKLEMKEKYFDGLLQLFYCGADCGVESWSPFSAGHCVRVVKSGDLNAGQAGAVEKGVENVFPFKRVLNWTEKTDYISATELSESGEMDDDAESEFVDEVTEELKNLSGEKLFGWPCWVQGVEYPKCRKCNK
jgi:Domain of unknown function (DUF1963)